MMTTPIKSLAPSATSAVRPASRFTALGRRWLGFLSLAIMRVRPFHIWWIGVLLFLPSCLMWGYFSVMCIWKFKQFGSLNWFGFTHVYFPLLAAVFGLCVPLICLWRFRGISARATLAFFSAFLALMLTWGVLDIRGEHYQVGGHDYPHGVIEDGHRYYWHLYFTWYFLPYKWIHGYNFD